MSNGVLLLCNLLWMSLPMDLACSVLYELLGVRVDPLVVQVEKQELVRGQTCLGKTLKLRVKIPLML